MRKVLVIALNCLTRTARDKMALLLLLLMPMLLIGILGFSLKGLMKDGQINPFEVLVVNADREAKPALPPGAPESAAADLPTVHYGKLLVDVVLGSDEVKRVLHATLVTDLEEAKDAVRQGKSVAVVHVPPNFSEAALADDPVAVELFTDPGRPTEADIVMQVIRGFAERIDAGLPGDSEATTPAITELPAGNKAVSAMQYYAAAMAIMFMIFTALGRAKDMIEERQTGTLYRLLTTPTEKATVLAGQVCGSVVVLLAQFLILMVGTRLLFGVYWGAWLPALGLGLAFAVAATGLGTAVASIFKDPKAADVVMAMAGQIFAALSGGMFPLYLFPESLKTVAKFIPNYWALQGFLDQMAGNGLSYLWPPVAILILMGTVSGTVGVWRLGER